MQFSVGVPYQNTSLNYEAGCQKFRIFILLSIRTVLNMRFTFIKSDLFYHVPEVSPFAKSATYLSRDPISNKCYRLYLGT